MPTIISRCKIVKFLPLPRQAIAAVLERGHGLDEDACLAALNFSEGSIGRAQDLLNSSVFANKNQLIDEFMRTDTAQARYKKNDLLHIIKILYSWHRDILVSRCGKTELLINADRKEALKDLAANISFEEIMRRLNSLEEIYNSIQLNANLELAQTALSVKLNK